MKITKKIGFFICAFLFYIQNVWSSNCSVSYDILNSLSVELLIYKSKKQKGKVLILPPISGVTYIDKQYARSLCKAGFSAFVIKKWKGMDEESLQLDIHAHLLTTAQKVIAKVIEKKTQPGEFIGILGTSVGAIHSATALGNYDQIQAGFLILGGAPIHKVIAYSDETALKKYRKRRMENFRFKTVEDYALALDKKIPKNVCPLYFSKKAQKKDVFTVIALKDLILPTKYQKELQQAFQSKKLELSSSHVLSIIKFYFFHSKKMIKFFETSANKFKKTEALF